MRIILAACLLLTLAPSTFAQQPYSSMAGSARAVTKADLANYAKQYALAKSAFSRTPKSAAAKKAYVASTVRYATASMASDDLDRKVKYKQALKLYREALKVDPKNHEAKNNSDLIVSIYKSMHRPIPE